MGSEDYKLTCVEQALWSPVSPRPQHHMVRMGSQRETMIREEQDEQSVDEVNKPGAAHRWTELRGSAAVFQAVCCSVSRTLKKAFI